MVVDLDGHICITSIVEPSGWRTGTDGLARPAIDACLRCFRLRTLLPTHQQTLVPTYKPAQSNCYCVCGTEPPWLNG